jgi:hypothetical protein
MRLSNEAMLDPEMKGQARQIPYLHSGLGWEFEVMVGAKDIAGTDLITIRNCSIIPDQSAVTLRFRWRKQEFQGRREISLSVSNSHGPLKDYMTAGDKWRVHTFFNGDTFLLKFPSQAYLDRALSYAMRNPGLGFYKKRLDRWGKYQDVLYIPLESPFWLHNSSLGNLIEWEKKQA